VSTPSSYRSPWALAILSLLFERDMHPYEIRRLVRERGKGEFVDLRPGSLYRTIERLERARLVEPVETTREGRFPERTVYRITDNGREELQDWMREMLATPVNDFPQVVQALSVLPILEADDARLQLEGRLLRLEGEIAALRTSMRRLEGVLPRLFSVELELVLALRQAELACLRELVEDMRTGRLAWTQEQLRTEYADLASGRPMDLTQHFPSAEDGGDEEGGGMA
jgi:DNA-binding PadR family transcriptional regulator